MSATVRPMRDAVLETLIERMAADADLFLLSGDFGSPVLDRLRTQYPDRFINVGIAEQNLINVAAGMALEGCKVVAYAIAPFLTLRAFEQIRINLSLMAEFRPMTVVLIGVGAGFSYTLAGPTHQCLEDLTVMRALPNLDVYCPADWPTAQALVVQCLNRSRISYLRLDAAALPALPDPLGTGPHLGFRVLRTGGSLVLLATGYMSHVALRLTDRLAATGQTCGVIDLYTLLRFDTSALAGALAQYATIMSLEEGFVACGGLDALTLNLVNDYRLRCRVIAHGIPAGYRFGQGSREQLLAKAGLSEATLWQQVSHLATCENAPDEI
ncbi:MAG: transketolase [Candidatus Competibacteraceae bacterium]|nr:transketolase [Candidatus Competibacteraceae bacterium]